jgi:superfamily I DNA and/or RNA helicase
VRRFSHPTVPSAAALSNFRVIISTFSSVAQLVSAGFAPTHFATLILDEVGQAHIPEALVALAPFFSPNTRAILAGDHRQLGPIIQHKTAARLGLQDSLLDVLMSSFPAYFKCTSIDKSKVDENHGYNPCCVIKLVRNYRSHEALIRLPSALFYDNELIPAAPLPITSRYRGWPHLPNPEVPMIFRGLNSQHQREGSSPSFFNPIECVEVCAFVNRLLTDPQYPTRPTDIGVITPYHGQVKRIRRVLRNPAVRVGTVEEFQGQEKPVIIMSAVRSSADWSDVDIRHSLGFLHDPRRFNVAITRAMSLLIVVGSPTILRSDHNWMALIGYAQERRAYSGVPFD